MKKSMMGMMLITALCVGTTYAQTNEQAPSSDTSNTVQKTPELLQKQTIDANQTSVPASSQPSQATTPTPDPTTTSTVQSAPMPQSIDCNYKIPPEKNDLAQTLVLNWAKKAAVQSFDFNNVAIDSQLEALKTCYTKAGWQGFDDALQKSGNINAIKSQQLTVSSQVDGEANISVTKTNQWKVTLPMEVVYQNDKEKLTQLLTVDLIIGRKITGDLGIMQMIATPRKAGATSSTTDKMQTSTDTSPQTPQQTTTQQ